MTAVTFSQHALDRWAQRIGPASTLDAAVAKGVVQQHSPSGISFDRSAQVHEVEGWLVTPQAAFPLRTNPATGELIAVTCLRRRKLSKADRRARREAAHDEDWRAA